MAFSSKNNNTRPAGDDSVSLNKYISDTGFCSRREADDYIEQNRVTINDQEARKGQRVHPGDVVEIDGEPIKKKVKTLYIAFNKPAGVTSTTDQKDRDNIIRFISHPQRIFPIGRLDKDSDGLIFLTNDGDIVNKILRAGNSHEKEYIVTTDKPLTPEFLKQMSQGVKILGQYTRPCKVNQEAKFVFRITLTQGLNRQIRRMCEVLGYKVVKLTRVRIMNVSLGKLPSGHWRYLTPEELQQIQILVAQSSKTEEASQPKRSAPASRPAKAAEKPAAQPAARPAKTGQKSDSKGKSPQEPHSYKKPAGKKGSFKSFREGGRKQSGRR